MPATRLKICENENNESTTRRLVVIIRTTRHLDDRVVAPGQCAVQLRRAMVWSDAPSPSPGAFLASRLLYSLSAPECCAQKGIIQDVEVRCYLILTRLQ